MVCTRSFPSMPLGFRNDPGDARYRAAYYEHFPGVWRHGDYVHGRPIKNKEALANPEALEHFRDIPALRV